MSRFLILCLVTVGFHISNSIERKKIVYDSFTSLPAAEDVIQKYRKASIEDICTKKIEECNPDDYRRLDGSCNNLDNPAVGTFNTPMIRLLPPSFGANFTVRTAEDGGPLTPERKCRTELLGEGKSSHPYYTMLFGHFLVGLYTDSHTVHDTINFFKNTTYCCTEEGADNPICAPIEVPEDDPVHRFSKVRCLNQTKPQTFQYFGCAADDTVPTRIGNTTHAIDLSLMYYDTPTAMDTARSFEGGLLKYEVINGFVLPPNGTSVNRCLTNVLPKENYCFAVQNNGIIGPSLIIVWFYRLHNMIARELAAMNPCWSDHKLFYTSKQIVIAMWLQIQFYELLPLILGKTNIVKSGLISLGLGFRKIYKPKNSQALSVEYGFTGRWYHTMQEGTIEMYNEDGELVEDVPVTNLTLRTGFMAIDNHIPMITRGALRQRFGGADYMVDPNMAEIGLGTVQHVTDVPTNDLSKGRLVGLRPYIDYKQLFNPNKKYDTFDDLRGDIDDDRLERLKRLYKTPGDIDMLAGMWAEKPIETLGCTPLQCQIMMKELKRMMRADRHWYELQDAPHAFKLRQLLEIRKVTAASILCTVGDGITKIQPHAFRVAGPGNRMRSCSEIPKINFNAWKDKQC